jgi:C2 domain
MIFDKNYGNKSSSKKADEISPEYDETFTWEIEDTEGVNNLVLTCKIMDDDMLLDDKIGVAKIKLEDLALTAEPIGVDRVVDNNWFCKDARIYLTISYS